MSCRNEGSKLNRIERDAILRVIFVDIYPFSDENGRKARLFLNLESMKDGHPSVIIKIENQLSYYGHLDKAHTIASFEISFI